MATRSDLLPNINSLEIGTQAASIALPGMKFNRPSRIKSVSLINQAALAADNTNFLQVQLQDLAGNNLATFDSRAANQGALVANTPVDCPLNSALAAGPCSYVPHGGSGAGEIFLPAGQGVLVNVVKNGTGVPTLAQIQIEWYPC